jgi:hypothetical protein
MAENLLLRGRYRGTHFRADQTELPAVSRMGNVPDEQEDKVSALNCSAFVPRFAIKARYHTVVGGTSPQRVFDVKLHLRKRERPLLLSDFHHPDQTPY